MASPEPAHRPPAVRKASPPAKRVAKRKPERDPFRTYSPLLSQKNSTMVDFWIIQGWYNRDRVGIKLTNAKWKDDPQVRIEAIKFLVDKVLRKPPKEVTGEDFNSNKLPRIIRDYYDGSYDALVAAGYAYSIEESLKHAGTGTFQTDKFYPWEMPVVPTNFHDKEEHRIAQITWLVWKVGGNARDIIYADFYSNNLGGLLAKHYGNSPYNALLEAGIVSSDDEVYMRRTGGARYQETG